MNYIYDLHQGAQIRSNLQEAEDAARRANKAENLCEELLQRHEKMALVFQALLELVQERTGITNEELEKKVLEVDLRDGKADGRMKAQILECPTCGRNVFSKRPVCIFCGSKAETGHAF